MYDSYDLELCTMYDSHSVYLCILWTICMYKFNRSHVVVFHIFLFHLPIFDENWPVFGKILSKIATEKIGRFIGRNSVFSVFSVHLSSPVSFCRIFSIFSKNEIGEVQFF
jgi:hypothetical protein